jgi:exodeoxyribonuclease V gamma subunit
MSGYRRRKKGNAHTDFIQELDPRPIDTLTFEQLQRFWAHPVRAFFQQRLQVNFRSEESEIPDAEPFTLEGLERYQLNLQLLNALVEEEDADKLYRRYRAAGSCPMGVWGNRLGGAVPGDDRSGRARKSVPTAGEKY